MDTTDLEGAYRELLHVARQGGFKPPSEDGAWGAERVLARVVVNDRLLATASAQVLARASTSYNNSTANNEAHLEALIRGVNSWDGLLAAVRATGLELVYLARELDESAAATPVQTRIADGETVRMEAPMPWSGVLNTHAEVHLPERRAQLQALQA